MFERFTDKARTVVILANAKATERGDQIRPVYMLHALVSAEGVAARALSGLGVDADTVERELDRTAPLGNPLEAEAASGDAEALATIGIDLDEIKRKIEENFGPGALGRVPRTQQGPFNWTGRRALTRESKQSLGLALKEARAMRHNYIGTEHLLLGLLRTAEGNRRGDFTPDTLRNLGIDPAQARQRVLAELHCASALPCGPLPRKHIQLTSPAHPSRHTGFVLQTASMEHCCCSSDSDGASMSFDRATRQFPAGAILTIRLDAANYLDRTNCLYEEYLYDYIEP